MDPILERLMVGVFLVAFVGIPASVTWVKGHRAAFMFGVLVIGFAWWVYCLRLARPSSQWARRFYGPDKMERARGRYEG